MSVWVALQMKTKDNTFEKLETFLEANLPRVRGFAGALSVSLFHDQETGNFLIFEEWLSREHHQEYLEFIAENGVMNQLLQFMQGPPTIAYFDKLSI